MTWDEAKKEIDSMQFPKDGGFFETHENISHDKKKASHAMKGYRKIFKLGDFDAEAVYSVCPKCKQIRNKSVRTFNNDIRTCYEKWFVIRGQEVNGQNIEDLVEDIFAD